jgi:hypothetical protein
MDFSLPRAVDAGQRKVAFWSIDTPIVEYGVADALVLSDNETSRARDDIRTSHPQTCRAGAEGENAEVTRD